MLKCYKFTCPYCGEHELCRELHLTKMHGAGDRIYIDAICPELNLYGSTIPNSKTDDPVEFVTKITYGCNSCHKLTSIPLSDMLGKGYLEEATEENGEGEESR